MKVKSLAVFTSKIRAAAILAVCALCAAAVLVEFALPARASGGRSFAGIYQVSNVTDLGEQIRLTFAARIFNYSDADVTSATVSLKGPGAPSGTYATFNSVTLRDKESVRLSQDVTLPKSQYAGWSKGHTPVLLVQYLDLSGSAQQCAVELSRGPVGQE